jgi:hypothetical protein
LTAITIDDTNGWEVAKPHPLCDGAADRMVVSVAMIIFEDDVSGAQSKQWNKHYCIYANNVCLPRQKVHEENNVHFVATSSFASPIEMMQGVRRSIE